LWQGGCFFLVLPGFVDDRGKRMPRYQPPSLATVQQSVFDILYGFPADRCAQCLGANFHHGKVQSVLEMYTGNEGGKGQWKQHVLS
jgi:hypothetical protein